MTRRGLAAGLALAATLGFAGGGAAQTVRGIVTDASTGDALALATVNLISAGDGQVASALTTEDGFFSLAADAEGVFLLRSTALGYAPTRLGPIELRSEELRVVEVPMDPAPLGIEGLVVDGMRAIGADDYLGQRGFWERFTEGRGEFLTPAQVLASDAMWTVHLLREVDRIVPQYGAAPWTVWPLIGVSNGCEPRVFVDDVWMNRGDSGIRDTWGLDDIVPINRVYAVEVYHGPFQAPLRYQGTTSDNVCGVILIWTR